MHFKNFIASIPKIEKETLLADKAHIKMMPPDRNEVLKKTKVKAENPKTAAVLMLLYPKNNQTHLVLIERNSYIGAHSSQIAFPGGKVELEDPSTAFTALRETKEEIGIPIDKINIVKAFTKVYIPPSNFLVFPFLGYASEELQFTLDAREVASIIEFPVADLLNESAIVYKKMSTSYSTDIFVPAFKIQEFYVWGATAMMLSELKEILKKVV